MPVLIDSYGRPLTAADVDADFASQLGVNYTIFAGSNITFSITGGKFIG